MPALTASVDYFNIKVDGYVARIAGGTQGLVSTCFAQNINTSGELAANQYCSLLTRRANGELLAAVPLTNELSPGVNNVLKTEGIDFTVGYNVGLAFTGMAKSKLLLSTNVTYLMKYEFNGGRFEGQSTGDFGTLPKWKANTRVGFDNGDFSATVNWRYFGKVFDTGNEVDVKAQNYFDLSLRFRADDNFEFYGGVNNLFDRQPPVINSGITATNTDEQVYDTLGRRYFVGATIRY